MDADETASAAEMENLVLRRDAALDDLARLRAHLRDVEMRVEGLRTDIEVGESRQQRTTTRHRGGRRRVREVRAALDKAEQRLAIARADRT